MLNKSLTTHNQYPHFPAREGFWGPKIRVMIREKQEHTGPIIIDLIGPDGNAFALMGYAKRFATQLGWKDKGAALINEMMEDDYEHLLEVFDNAFGEFVILER